MRQWMVPVLVFVFMAILLPCGVADGLVTYRVHAEGSESWDVRVNDVVFVRHHPTGVGPSYYGGNFNRALSNGWNTVSLTRVGESNVNQSGNMRIEIDFVSDIGSGAEPNQVVEILRYTGNSNTNLVFKNPCVSDGLAGAIVRQFRKGKNREALLSLLGVVSYVLVVNVYGLVMVVNDRKFAKAHLERISVDRFVWNAVFGGGVGLLFGIVIRRHVMNRRVAFFAIPVILAFQLAALVCFFTPQGQSLVHRILPNSLKMAAPSHVRGAPKFIDSFRRKDEFL